MKRGIHQDQPRMEINPDHLPAQKTVILLHGRGSTAQAVAPLAIELQVGDVKFIIPQAAKNRWYPETAFGPLEANEPDLSSALALISDLIAEIKADGIPPEKIFLGGFSQGACLAAEYAARHADRYGGLFIFSGALIGPPGAPRDDQGKFEGTPVFIGGSDADPWVDHDLMARAAKVFEDMGAAVDFRTYPGMGHTVNKDELRAVREMVKKS